MSGKRQRSPSPFAPSDIFRSAPIEDRSSRFVAIYSPNLSANEVQARAEFESATHRIAAWRRRSNQRALNSQPLIDICHDDDGEKYGGKTLEKVLITMDVEGVVVVARWYGSVMLGPVRFEHLKNCATEAILKWKQEQLVLTKRLKIERDDRDRSELASVLAERDQSIVVLRGLLAEKAQPISSQDGEKAAAQKVPNYAAMPLPTLRKLEQVRDATIGWILHKIEKAENAEQSQQHHGAQQTPTTVVNDHGLKSDKPPPDTDTALVNGLKDG